MRYSIIICLFAIGLVACEQEYTPVRPDGGPKYVVEGYIEAGENPLPPYVFLTRTLDFNGEIGPDQFTSSYVHDADVRVSDGTNEVVFQEICFSDLTPELQAELGSRFGIDPDSLMVDICVYLDVLQLLQPQEGKTYTLRIVNGSDSISAVTTIPPYVPLDSFYFQPPPGVPNDTLARLRCFVQDPPGMRNFYRYFGGTNGNNLTTSFSSVFEDLFFDGKSFGFQLFNPETDNGDVEPDEYGLYVVGDTATIKWCTLDEAHFNFWNTLEFSNANQGPLSGYTRLETNINGGLGIWGGYHVRYYTRVVSY